MTSPAPQANQNSPNLLTHIFTIIALLLRFVLTPLRILVTYVFPPHEFDGPTTFDKAAVTFSSAFESQYSNSHPPSSSENGTPATSDATPVFETTGYKKCLEESRTRNKFLFVYLHSPLHRDGETFARNVLSTSSVRTFLTSRDSCLVNWGGSIHTSDGATAAQSLNVVAYPFVAILVNSEGGNGRARGTEVLLKIDGVGKMRCEDFLERTRAAVMGHVEVLADVEQRRVRREEESRLREEQDREFQETLLADQIREAERRAQEQAAAEAERAVLLAEAEVEKRKNDLLTKSKGMLRKEPPPKEPHTSRIRLTLPSGVRVDRRFYNDDKIESLWAFLRLYFDEKQIDIFNFQLSTNFPKKSFEDGDMTLVDAGLAPQAVVMVQDMDA